jgi:hypothetical protein
VKELERRVLASPSYTGRTRGGVVAIWEALGAATGATDINEGAGAAGGAPGSTAGGRGSTLAGTSTAGAGTAFATVCAAWGGLLGGFSAPSV